MLILPSLPPFGSLLSNSDGQARMQQHHRDAPPSPGQELLTEINPSLSGLQLPEAVLRQGEGW